MYAKFKKNGQACTTSLRDVGNIVLVSIYFLFYLSRATVVYRMYRRCSDRSFFNCVDT